jgi:hypothetical protein
MNWTGRRRWAAECPQNWAKSNLGRETTSVDGEDGVTGGSHAALAANQPVG